MAAHSGLRAGIVWRRAHPDPYDDMIVASSLHLLQLACSQARVKVWLQPVRPCGCDWPGGRTGQGDCAVAVETIEGASVVLNDADRRLVAELEDFLREHQHDGVDDAIMLATADGQQHSLPYFLVRALHMLTTLLAQG